MASAWGKISSNQAILSLDEIAAQEVVRSMQEKKLKKKKSMNITTEEIIPKELDCSLNDTDSDAVIAQLLQNQYNREHDLMLKRTEEKFNGSSKVGISLSNFLTSSTPHPDDKRIDEDNRDLDRFVSVEKEYASIPRCGYKKTDEGTKIITKHDLLISSRINACRVLEFPPGISTGDTGGFDVKLNNKVFNSLRAHSHAHCARQKAKTRPHKF